MRRRRPGPQSFVEMLETHGPAFDVVDANESRSLDVSVSAVRRRRGRLADDRQSGYRDVALVERDGVLVWQLSWDPAGRAERAGPRRGRRRTTGVTPDRGTVLKEVSVPVLEPNEYLAALRNTDGKLNPDCDAGLRVVTHTADGRFELSTTGLKASFAGRTLVLVHGTFSSSANVVGELAATPEGRAFLADALAKYKGQVLVFDHPTLSVSPFLNALDLSRRLAGTKGELDVVAHSRGGLVTQWWLEVFGDALVGTKVRAVLVGAPLHGTHLAAPNRIQPLLSVLSNIGSLVEQTLSVAAAANPFALASFALLKFLGRRERNRWGLPPVDDIGSRPGTDAAVAVIPGLHGQSAVANNYELARLRAATARPFVRYYAVTADFEPARMGWKLWKVITEFGDRSMGAATDAIFPGRNDLVVDTDHMTSLATGRDITDVVTYPRQTIVHHCSYFRQPQTIKGLRKWLAIP
jgi:hypothetical protein